MPLRNQALAAPEEISGRRKGKDSNQSAEQDREVVSGPAERANLFSLQHRKASIYSNAQAPARPLPAGQDPPFDLRKETERITLERYAPAGLVVDSDLRIVHFQGDTSPFLKPTPGEASFHLLRLVRPELIVAIRTAIQEAKKLGTPARREGIPFKLDGQIHRTDLDVVPIRGRSPKGADFLVLFQKQRPDISEKRRATSARKSSKTAEDNEAERLKQLVTSLQDQLRSLLEDQEAAAEALRAANEELHNRNLELSQTASDLNRLLNAVEIPIVILESDRRIRRFTPVGEQLLNLIPSDVGRPISQIRPNLDIPDMDQMAAEVILRMASVARDVQDWRGHWYTLRMRPYLTLENRIDGILVVLVDIHDIKQYSTATVDSMRGCFLVLDSHFYVLLASPSFYQTFQVVREEIEGRLLWKLGNGQWNIFQLRERLEKVLPEKKEVVNFEVEHNFPAIGHKTMLLNARQLSQAGVWSPRIILVMEDITERKAAEERTRQLLARVTTATEEEGKRIARELHDSFGQRLTTLNLKVSEVKGLLSSQPDLAEKVEQIEEEISQASKAAHDLSRQLHPAALFQLGLETTLEAECANFSKLHEISVNFSAESVPESLSQAVGLCLYRIAQESLENVRKHAQSKTASVTLARKGREIVMVIQDFGRGFDLHVAREGDGLGLVSMEERVRLAKGRLSVTSKPGEGTRVEVRIPIGDIL